MVYTIADKAGVDPDDMATDIVNAVFGKFGQPQTVHTVTYSLSGYAAESDHELIAEAVAEYHSSANPRPLAKLVVEELKLRAKGAGLK